VRNQTGPARSGFAAMIRGLMACRSNLARPLTTVPGCNETAFGTNRRSIHRCAEGTSPYALSRAWFIPINVRVIQPVWAVAALKVDDCRQNRGRRPLR
jgi:hypothetical protein